MEQYGQATSCRLIYFIGFGAVYIKALKIGMKLYTFESEGKKLFKISLKIFKRNIFSVLGYLLHTLVSEKYGGRVEWDELGLPCTASGMALPCGATGRWMSE
mgnify:CR=1 FL=1